MSQTVPPTHASPVNGRAAREAASPTLGLPEPRTTLDAGPRQEAYDALTDLFLGGDGVTLRPRPQSPGSAAPTAAARGADAPATSAATVEGLILGHLPVLATAWASQYARNLAATLGGPVVLVRIRPGEATVDLVGDGAESVGTAQSLEDAVRLAAAWGRAWLVRVDETSEPRLTESWGLDAVTLLTGADEAAVVSSYQTIKHLFKPADVEETQGPEVRLAIMGATAKKAAEAAVKLERATEAFLRRKVSVVGCIAKIGAGKMGTIYRGPAGGAVDEVLTRLIPLIRSMPRPTRVPGATAPTPVVAVTTTVAMHPNTFSDPLDREPAKPASRLGLSAPTGEHGVARLSSHIAGLTPLQAVCPYAPRVQLAADSAGALHLLASTDEGLDASEAVGQLLTTAAWAAMHTSLLRLAGKADGARLDSTLKPVLHLMTSDPRAVRYLGDAELRLHLLARVELGGQSGWYCTDLN